MDELSILQLHNAINGYFSNLKTSTLSKKLCQRKVTKFWLGGKQFSWTNFLREEYFYAMNIPTRLIS